MAKNTKTTAKTKTTAPKGPKLPASIAEAVESATEKPTKAHVGKGFGGVPIDLRAPIKTRLVNNIERLAKRTKRLLALFEGEEQVVEALKAAANALAAAGSDADDLPETWKPQRGSGSGAKTREPLTVGAKVRIAKGVVEKYVQLLDEDEDPEVLNNLTLAKLGQKHSVVTTPSGAKFAVGTRVLRRAA